MKIHRLSAVKLKSETISKQKELDLVLIRVDDQFCEYILVPLEDFPRLAVSL